MDQGIGEPLDHGLVEFGVLAGRDELDILVKVMGKVMHQAPEATEQGTDRHHANTHGGVAQAGAQAFELFGNALEVAVAAECGNLGQSCLGNNQFADAIHQFVEPFGINTHR